MVRSHVGGRWGRDHSVEDGLEYVATWNSAQMVSDDLTAGMNAAVTRSSPSFSKM